MDTFEHFWTVLDSFGQFWTVLDSFGGLFEGLTKSSRESGMGLKKSSRTYQNVSKSAILDSFRDFWRLLDRLLEFQSRISHFSVTR